MMPSKVTLLSLICSWFSLAHSTCLYTANDESLKASYSLNMTCLEGITFDYYLPPYHFIYTPCRNGANCSNGQVIGMAVQSDASQCFLLGKYDNSGKASYNVTSKTWTVAWQNGDDCFGSPRGFSAVLKCNPNVAGNVTGLIEPESCDYQMMIETRYACIGQNYTCAGNSTNTTTTTTTSTTSSTTTSTTSSTTTTQLPGGSCYWQSENGQNSLNMTSIIGTSLSIQENSTVDNVFYIYTPCLNSLLCARNQLAMAYLVNTQKFECLQYFAVWENGVNKPTYDEQEQSWRFVYTNGEKCDDEEMIFVVNWNCDMNAKTPQLVQAKKDETCLYQLNVNSTLACN